MRLDSPAIRECCFKEQGSVARLRAPSRRWAESADKAGATEEAADEPRAPALLHSDRQASSNT
jgi:hypothetical protein